MCIVDNTHGVGFHRDVTSESHRTNSDSSDLVAHRLRACSIEIGHCNGGPNPGEQECRGMPDARAATHN